MFPERSYMVLFSITKKGWAPCFNHGVLQFSLSLPGTAFVILSIPSNSTVQAMISKLVHQDETGKTPT